MQAFSKDNNGIKYLLTVIDIYSKFVWIIPLKRKTMQEVANAFSRILKERRPSKMWVDKSPDSVIKTPKTSCALFYRKRSKILCDWKI